MAAAAAAAAVGQVAVFWTVILVTAGATLTFRRRQLVSSAMQLSGSSSTHWGVDQYDEDVAEHLPWYSGQGALKQVKKAASAVANVAKSVVVPNGQPQKQQQQLDQVADSAKEQSL